VTTGAAHATLEAMPNVVALNSSPSTGSKTHALARLAVDLSGGGRLIDLGALDAEALLGRTTHESVTDALTAVADADILVVATPVYRATYNGVLKLLFDQLDQAALVGTATVLCATAGSPLHYLSIDTGMRALVASLGGWSVPTAVYATGEDFGDANVPGPAITRLLEQALAEAAQITS
jgi:FMN reductase